MIKQRKHRVGLLGFGRAGKAVATVLARADDVELRWVARESAALHGKKIQELFDLDIQSAAMINSLSVREFGQLIEEEPVDVLVDFSTSQSIHEYSEFLNGREIALITAISAYGDEEADVMKELSEKIRVIHSPNITIGVNFLLIASKILRNIAPNADIEIVEEHFSAKPETSGTAKIIAEKLDVDPDQIKSVRAGGIIGVHEIIFGFPNQTVRLIHESITREAFGNGVLFAIRHLPKEKCGLFNMEDLLRDYFVLDPGPADDARSASRPWWKFWLSEIPKQRYAN